jgi:CelD/BcsL family acetyltransferase involved in cellulose biosynthesis
MVCADQHRPLRKEESSNNTLKLRAHVNNAPDSAVSVEDVEAVLQSAGRLLAAPGCQLDCTLVTSFDALEHLRASWDDAAIRLGGSIYMSYDWCRIWWEFYGGNQRLRIFIFRFEKQIVGIVPIYIDCVRLWPLKTMVAKLVGSNIPPKVFSPPIDPTWAEQIFGAIAHQLFQEDECHALSFGPVSELYLPMKSLLSACRRMPSSVSKATTTQSGVHTVWSMPKTMEEYYQSLSRNERRSRKADLKKLQTEHSARIEVVSDAEQVKHEFDNFMRQHTEQWRAGGKAGHFGAWPNAGEFNRSLVAAHGKLGRVRFIRMAVTGGTIANLYAFAFGGSYYCELPARSLDPQWDRFSLGSAGIVLTADAAIKEGMARMEGGLGHYDYKIRLKAKEYTAITARIAAKGFPNRLRMLLFTALRLGLLCGYQKVWYRRIVPHLPLSARRPQWGLWLRLDF